MHRPGASGASPAGSWERYWGWYSNAARGQRHRLQGEVWHHAQKATESGDEAKSRRLSWSQLIREVSEIDPPLCTFCGATMLIVAFIVERSSLSGPSQVVLLAR